MLNVLFCIAFSISKWNNSICDFKIGPNDVCNDISVLVGAVLLLVPTLPLLPLLPVLLLLLLLL